MEGKVQELEVNMAEIKKDISYIKESVQSVDEKFDKFIDAVNHRFEEVENNIEQGFAKKYVEKLLWWLMGLLGAAFSFLIGKQ